MSTNTWKSFESFEIEPETELFDDIAVTNISGGDGDGANMVFTFNNIHISVSVLPSNGLSTKDSRHLKPESRSLQDHIVDTLSRASICEDYEEYDQLVDEVLMVILDVGKHLFRQSTLREAESCETQILHVLLFPEFVCFRLEAPGRSASLVPIAASEANIILAVDPVYDQEFVEDLKIAEDVPS
ncbi:hypothetical protein ACHAPU_009716 [Fusarium lateritium]